MSEALKRIFPVRIVSRRWRNGLDAPSEVSVLMDNDHVFTYDLRVEQPRPHIFRDSDSRVMEIGYQPKHAKNDR